jgi:signal transduction histidine kinase
MPDPVSSDLLENALPVDGSGPAKGDTGMTVDEVIAVLHKMDVLSEFTPEQYRWMADHGEVVEIPAGQTAVTAGDAQAGFWMLMSGRVSLLNADDKGRSVVTSTTEHLGSWAGRIPLTGEPSPVTLRAEVPTRFLRLSDADADAMLASGMPIAKHLIAGIQMGSRRFEARLRERERLASLGRLSAGLSHELNNPAAAIARAASQLRSALVEQHKLAICLRATPATADTLVKAGEELAALAENGTALSGLERADAEEAVAIWLEDRGAPTAWDAAPVLVESGVDVGWLEARLPNIAEADLGSVIAVLTSAATTHQLTLEIEQASARISTLVKSVKTYTNMDGAERQDVDVRLGLKSTMVMLGHKLKHHTVTHDWPKELPTVPGNPGELNQVWTNLLDNATDAIGDRPDGTIDVRVTCDDEWVVVTISDNGPGMPPDVADKIFDPFFTTKAVGSGTGMGLDFVWKIITNVHHGRVSVDTVPGRGTSFIIELPRHPRKATATAS